jgi:hypothetical protein
MENKNYSQLLENNSYSKLFRIIPDELNLTNRQTKKIYEFEEERLSSWGDMSHWEEWEYERSIFGKILSEDQFKIYNKNLIGIIRQHEKELKEEDEYRECEIEYYKDLLWFLENDLLYYLRTEIKEWQYLELYTEKARITFLRSEYRLFWNRSRERDLQEHFRFGRVFQPNGLQSLLLKNQLNSLLPDYWAFYKSADTDVKSVIDYLRKNPIGRSFDEKLLAKKWSELKSVHEESLKKCGRHFEGWDVMAARHSEEQAREERLMILILTDKTHQLVEE